MNSNEYDQLCQDYITALYKGYSGFISYQPGEKEAHVEKKIYLTYGEILYASVNKIIEHIQVDENDVFYDLGSGIGKVALHFFLKTPIKKAWGIEASAKRNHMAEKIYTQVQAEFPELFANNRSLGCEVGNFLEINIQDATIIYSCSTCFSEELLADMGKVMDQCPKLKYIVSMKAIPNKLPLKEVLDIDCTWDKTKCHIYTLPK